MAERAEAPDINGRWSGVFRYYASQDLGEWPFKARLVVKDSRLSGIVLEPHITGVGEVKAEIVGTFDGRSAEFTKRYLSDLEDYSREVHYEGTLADDGRSIAGAWKHSANSGEFEMQKVD